MRQSDKIGREFKKERRQARLKTPLEVFQSTQNSKGFSRDGMSWNRQGSVYPGIFKALNTLGSVSAHEVKVLPGPITVFRGYCQAQNALGLARAQYSIPRVLSGPKRCGYCQWPYCPGTARAQYYLLSRYCQALNALGTASAHTVQVLPGPSIL